MIGNARPLIEVGLHLVKDVWYVYWRGGLYGVPPGVDHRFYLVDHLLAALRGWSADYKMGLYAGAPNSHSFKAQHQIVIRISQFDLFADERDDYVLDTVFDGVRSVYCCQREKLGSSVHEIIGSMDLEIIQAKLSQP